MRRPALAAASVALSARRLPGRLPGRVPGRLLGGLLCGLLGSWGCGGDDGESAPLAPVEDDTVPFSSTGEDTDASSGGSGDEDGVGADLCLAAAAVGPGRYAGNLAGADSNGGGACQQGGPEVFFRIEVSQRVDVSVSAVGLNFEPRVGVFGSDCAARFDEFGLLCTQGVPGWVADVAPGTQLYIAVGADADQLGADLAGHPFELEVATRPVLAAGEPCGEPLPGRCASGTVCVLAEGDLADLPRCTPVPGDRCSSATTVEVRRGDELALPIEFNAPHSDAHAHSCGGDRIAERVYRLELPETLEDTELRVEGEGLVALAARGPTCLTEEERGCTVGAEPLALSPPPARTIYVFAELAEAERSEDAPAVVRVSLTSVQPPP